MKGRAGIGVLLVVAPPCVAVFLEGVCVSLSLTSDCRTVQVQHAQDSP